MIRLKHLFLCLFISTLYSKGKAQFLVDGFQKEQGDVVLAAGAGFQSWKKFYAFDGNVGLSRKSTIYSGYLSINPIKQIRIAGSLPFIKVDGSNQGSFQDIFIQAQYLPFTYKGLSPYAILSYGAPLRPYETESAIAIGQQAMIRAYGLGLQYTKNWWFVSAAFQHQEKSKPTPNAKQAQFKVGAFKNKWFAALRYDIQYSTGGSDYRDNTFRPFTTLGSGYNKLGLDVYRRLNNFLGASISVNQTLSGRNVGNSTEVFISLIADLKISKKGK